MSQVRNRVGQTVVETANMESNNNEDLFDRHHGKNLSAKSLLDTEPQQHGSVLKLHIPILYSIMPGFIQRLILSWPFLAKWFGPTWKQRYLVLCGSYLYKFTNMASKKTKGSPFDVQTTNAEVCQMNSTSLSQDIGMFSLPPGYAGMFCLSTLRRTHYYAVMDDEEATVWVRTFHEAKQATIKRNMGHSSNMPYPLKWKYFDSVGNDLVQTNERIKNKLETSKLSEMEMTGLIGIGGGVGGGPIPRGYYG